MKDFPLQKEIRQLVFIRRLDIEHDGCFHLYVLHHNVVTA